MDRSMRATRSQGVEGLRENLKVLQDFLQQLIPEGKTIVDNPPTDISGVIKFRGLLKNLQAHIDHHKPRFEEIISLFKARLDQQEISENEYAQLVKAEKARFEPVFEEAYSLEIRLLGIKDMVDEVYQQQKEIRDYQFEADRSRMKAEQEGKSFQQRLAEMQAQAQIDLEKEKEVNKLKLEQQRLQQEQDQAERVANLEGIKLELEMQKIKLLESGNVAAPEISQVFSNHNSAPMVTPNLQGTSRNHRTGIKLPKYEVKKFKGDRMQYHSFIQLFLKSVGSSDISPEEKLAYLVEYTEGEAREEIERLEISEANYQVALNKLEYRFGNVQIVQDAHMAQILDMGNKEGWPTSSVKDLREFHNIMESNLQALENLGVSTDQDRMMLTFLKSKLPYAAGFELTKMKATRGEDWSLPLFRDLFQIYLTSREEMEAIRPQGKMKEKPDSSPVQRHQWKPSGQQQQSSGHQQQQSPGHSGFKSSFRPKAQGFVGSSKIPENGCIFCSGKHWADECKQYADVQSRKAQIKGKCVICFKSHESGQCPVKSKPCYHCGKTGHHRSLCYQKFDSGSGSDAKFKKVNGHMGKSSPAVPDVGKVNMSEEVKGQSIDDRPTDVQLKTASACIRNPVVKHKGLQIRILLDDGSDRTYLSEQAAMQLGLKPISQEKLEIYKLRMKTPDVVPSSVVSLELQLKNGSYKRLVASVIDPVAGPITRHPVRGLDLPLLQDMQASLADQLARTTEDVQIDLLIGSDYYEQMVEDRRIPLPSDGLFLRASKLGFVLSGSCSSGSVMQDSTARVTGFLSVTQLPFSGSAAQKIDSSDEDLLLMSSPEKTSAMDPDVSQMWALENIGIQDSGQVNDDDQALETFNSTVELKDGRYFVTLPWKEDREMVKKTLPDNYGLAFGRLKSLMKRMLEGPKEHLDKYNKIIQEQLQRDMVEIVKDDTEVGEIFHYIPHHAVITPDKETTKVRIVMDGSARMSKAAKSLNQLLHRGPVMLKDLCGLLLRFRISPVAMVSDIEKAFLTVGMQLKDRDVLRFLWFVDPKKGFTKDNLLIYRFKRVPFGLISSPHLLAATVAYHLRKQETPCADSMLRNLYVDNVLTGVNSTEDGVKFYTEAKQIFRDASMNLREWTSNDKKLVEQIPEVDRAKGDQVKVLGMLWDLNKDCLQITGADKFEPVDVKVKRELLKALATVYDPLGFVSPVLIRLRIAIQDLWKEKSGWDDPFPDVVKQKVPALMDDLHGIKDIRIPRYLGGRLNCKPENLQFDLLVFTDASKVAYGAVSYLRITNIEDSSVAVQLIFSKAKVAPVKELTIPRLELLGVLIGSRMMDYLQQQLQLEFKQNFLFTDSQCVLEWIKSRKPLTGWVERRLTPIQNFIHQLKIEVNYIPTEENPADLTSRGISAAEIKRCDLWWHGPSWIVKPIEQWPAFQVPTVTSASLAEAQEASEAEVLFQTSLQSSSKSRGEGPTGRDGFLGIDANNFSKLSHLLRVTAWCLRFKSQLKRRLEIKRNSVQLSQVPDELTAKEIQKAQFQWDKQVQKIHFGHEIKLLEGKHSSNLIRQMGLFLDPEGILRCSDRMKNASFTEGMKFPKLLPSKDPYTELIILQSHQKVMHSGVSHTLAELRQEYWIPKGRSTVKSVLKGQKKCLQCIAVEGGPYVPPDMAALPFSRVSRSVPFSHSGVDYLGPIYVRNQKTGETYKVWIALFTCMAVRAVHLEVVEKMTAECFLNCLRRFISRRGKPDELVSDNGGYFLLTQKTLNKFWTPREPDPAIQSYLSVEKIKWKLIPELAPWMGGFYERLVSNVKRALRKVLGKQTPSSDQLGTMIVEIEAVINSRPLTYVGPDLDESSVLTPAHFLQPGAKTGTPEFDCSDLKDQDYQPGRIESVKSLHRFWKRSQEQLNQFWQIWQKEYLMSLRERRQQVLKSPRIQSQQSPRIGEVVLIYEDRMPRGSWKRGRIAELISGADGEIRVALILMPDKSVLRRAVKHLYPLECCGEDDEPPVLKQMAKIVVPEPRKQPSRMAENKANEKMRGQVDSNGSSDDE